MRRACSEMIKFNFVVSCVASNWILLSVKLEHRVWKGGEKGTENTWTFTLWEVIISTYYSSLKHDKNLMSLTLLNESSLHCD